MKSSPKLSSVSSIALVATIASFGSIANAQSEDSTIEDSSLVQDTVTVTARKRAENAQDVPITLNAFGEDDIDRFQIETLEDLEALITSSEFIADTGNPFQTEIIIRGGGVGRQLNVDGGTGLYANGINVQGGNFGGRSLWDIDTFDVQRYEVLKGPQGALYGRNALGGAINVISKRPSLDATALKVRGGIFDNEGYSIAGFGDLPIVQDKFAIRVAAEHYDQSEGFYFNSAQNDFIDAAEETNFRASALWRLNEDWDALFQYDYYDTTREGDLTYITTVVPDPFERAFDDPNEGSKEEESFYAALRGTLSFGEFNLIVNNRTREADRVSDLDQGVASAVFDPDTQEACFSVMMMGVTSIPGGQRCTEAETGQFERTSIEARLNGEADRLDWIVGADWFESEDEFTQEVAGRSVNSFFFDLGNEVSSWSLFGGGEYALTDRLSLGAEARFTSEDKNLSSVAELTEPPVAGVNVFNTTFDETFEYSTWTVFGSYEIREDALAYARIGSGFRTGGINSDSRDLDDGTGNIIEVPDTFDEERAISYEAGLKTAWLEGALIVNGSVFFVEYEDFISNANNGLAGLDRVQFVTNLGDAELFGAEIDGQYRIEDFVGGSSLSLSGAVGYNDGEVKNSVNPTLEGVSISRLPEWSVSATAQLDAPISSALTGFGSLTYSGQTGGFQTFSNTIELSEPQLFNLQLGVRGESWSLAGNVRNLFDEDELIRNPTSNNVALARDPTTWSVIFTKSFGG